MNLPLISVVVPVFNGEKYLGAALAVLAAPMLRTAYATAPIPDTNSACPGGVKQDTLPSPTTQIEAAPLIAPPVAT